MGMNMGVFLVCPVEHQIFLAVQVNVGWSCNWKVCKYKCFGQLQCARLQKSSIENFQFDQLNSRVKLG